MVFPLVGGATPSIGGPAEQFNAEPLQSMVLVLPAVVSHIAMPTLERVLIAS
jgi:hypothetical protein